MSVPQKCHKNTELLAYIKEKQTNICCTFAVAKVFTMKDNSIKLFESKQIRTAWDEEQEKWYFSVVDVVAALADSANPTDYLKKMRQRDPELSKGWGQIVPPPPLTYKTAGGPQKLNFADTESDDKPEDEEQTE